MGDANLARTAASLTSASVAGTECWTERSTYLHRDESRGPSATPDSVNPLPTVGR